jgi:DNA-binding MarR family transcriptional regulator
METELSKIIQEWSQVFMHRSGHDFKRFMVETGLSFSQINILMRLFHGHECDVSGLGEDMGFSNAAASQAVDRLVQMGLIERSEDPADRRSKQLTLTDQGRALVENGIQARSQWFADAARQLNEDQQKTIISALTILIDLAHKTTH